MERVTEKILGWAAVKADITEWWFVLLVLAFPGLGALFNGTIGRRLPRNIVGLIACGAIGLSFLSGLSLLLALLSLPPPQRIIHITVYPWLEAALISIDFSLLIDPLSVTMVLTVTFVSFLIHIYSVGYMGRDPEFSRYFALLNLFVFFMLTLVLAGNLGVMFIGWEGVGFCSFALISFWFTRKRAAEAGRKAFLVTRLGDFGFLVATLALLATFHTLNVVDIAHALRHDETITPWWGTKVTATQALQMPTRFFGLTLGTLLCLGLFMGAVGKSAQFPFYVWLPDAMEGPTPVSALIHAATMVTAGVYMVARWHFLFDLSPLSLTVIGVVGAFTAFYGATIGCVENDIKRVLAYSTISQIGYMVLACGVGAYGSGIYHLITHAFFKALLFLCAGSVMHALHDVLDIRKMGGLMKRMPMTGITFWIGALALAGILPGGLFSKDMVLQPVAERAWALWWIGVLTAFLTAFYTVRLGLKVFHGQPRDRKLFGVAHESPPVMVIPMVLLAVGTLASGSLWVPIFLGHGKMLPEFLTPSLGAPFEASPRLEGIRAGFVFAAASLGVALALWAYGRRPGIMAGLTQHFPWLYRLVARKYFVDELYDALIVRPGRRLSERVSAHFDVGVIDAIVNGVGWVTARFSETVRRTQTGFVRNYALYLIAASVVLLLYSFIRGIIER